MNPQKTINTYDAKFDEFIQASIDISKSTCTPAEFVEAVKAYDPYGSFDSGLTPIDFVGQMPINGAAEVAIDDGKCQNCNACIVEEYAPGPEDGTCPKTYFCDVHETMEEPTNSCDVYEFDNGEEK